MTAMALTSQRSRTSRTSRTLRRLSLKLGTLVIAALAVTMALGLAAPAAGQAAVSVQRLGYCGGDDWAAAAGADRTPLFRPITPFARDTRCDPASRQTNPRVHSQVFSDGGQTINAPPLV